MNGVESSMNNKTTIDFSRQAPTLSRTDKAEALGCSVLSKAGMLLILAIILWAGLHVLAYAEGWNVLRVTPLGALAIAFLADIIQTLAKD